MSDWPELLKTALLGTRREQLPQFEPDGQPGQLLARLDTEDQEGTLLGAAASIALYEHVGQQPVQDIHPSLPAPDLDGDRAALPPSAGDLETLLKTRNQTALAEFLIALNEAGLRLPDESLPNVLEYGRRLDNQRLVILPVLGERGRWLACQNPGWTYAALDSLSWDELSDLWRSENGQQQRGLLGQLRHTNPRIGRELLESTWKTTPAAFRRQFIRLIKTGLSMEDEPFLETALDDRDNLVRRDASQLLARLPTSRFSQRMAKNAGKILTWMPGQEQHIKIAFPTQINDQMKRDGVPYTPGKSAAHFRSRQLIAIISATPLIYWTTTWEVEPEVMVSAVLSTGWKRTLITGLTNAAERQGNIAWARALLTEDGINRRTGKLIRLFSQAECHQLVQQLVEEANPWQPLNRDNPLLIILRHWQDPWNEATAIIWIDQLTKHIEYARNNAGVDLSLRTLMGSFGKTFPSEIANLAKQRLIPAAEGDPTWSKLVERIINDLVYRWEILAKLEQGISDFGF